MRWALWGLFLVTALGGCSHGLGEPCRSGRDCPSELECLFPPHDGGNFSGVCDHAPRGLGERCSAAAECQPSLTCSNHFAPGTRYGECVARRGAGEACFLARDCVSGKCVGATPGNADGQCAGP